jgi:hypothetical protein
VWLDENRLKFHVQFATAEEYEFADTIYKLYKGGYLRATSVGFMPLDSEPMEKDEDSFMRPTRYLKQDLLELSACPVPANPNALAEAKAKGLVSDEAVEVLSQEVEEEEAKEYEEVKAAISYESAHPDGTPKADEGTEWDAGKEVAAAEVEDMKVMCAIVQGDPDQKTSYKLPHHTAKGHKVVWQGVAAAGAVLMGARGGIDASEAEKTGAKAHIAKHYEEFDRKPPWKDASGQESIADEMDYLLRLVEMEGLNDENLERGWELVEHIMRLSGSDIPVEIKYGAVLNKANRARLNKIKTLAQEVLDSAEEPDEPEKGISDEEAKALITECVSGVLAQAMGNTRRR